METIGRVSRSKNHSEYGFWDLEPYYLGLGPSGLGGSGISRGELVGLSGAVYIGF